jgi:hypothetical protein
MLFTYPLMTAIQEISNLNRFREGIHDFCDRQSFVYEDLAGGKRRKGLN